MNTDDVCRLSGATRRQVDTWASTGLLKSVTIARGRSYAPIEADVARALSRLSRHGIRTSSSLAQRVCTAVRLDHARVADEWVIVDIDGLIRP